MTYEIGQKVKFQTRNNSEGLTGQGIITAIYSDIRTKYEVEQGPYAGQEITSQVMCFEEELQSLEMINCQETDLNRKLAEDAHRGTSQTPKIRGQQEIDGYIAEMESVSDHFAPFATAENEAELRADLERYRQGYLAKLNARLSAHSNCVSTMIAGPSGFNHRRYEKANNTEHRRSTEFIEWREKALKRLNLNYNPEALARRPIRSDEADAIEQLQAKIESAEKKQTMMKAINRVVKSKKLSLDDKIDRLEKFEVKAETALRFSTEPNGHGGYGFPSYELTNNNANIKRMKARVATLQAEAAREDVEDRDALIDETAVTIVEDRDEGRIQLVFDGEPPKSIKKILNANAFNWSRKNGAWQRLLNDSSRRVVETLTTSQLPEGV